MSQAALLMIGIILYLLASYIFQEELKDQTPERPTSKFPTLSLKRFTAEPPSWHHDNKSNHP